LNGGIKFIAINFTSRCSEKFLWQQKFTRGQIP
jgi:hypothetical protein